MDNREDKIRVRAYEIWERQGRTGHPEDHWHEAERELKAQEGSTKGHGDATVQEAPPIKAVEAVEDTSTGPAKPKGSR